MNNQQAINLLKGLEKNLDDYCELNDEGKTAFRMAIEALSCSDIPNNSDIISRQQAIDALKEKVFHNLSDEFYGAMQVLDELPSVQPERKTGRWIPTTNGRGGHECSRCHEYAPCYQDGSEHLSTFCVLCGAKMEEGEQE